ncbi:UBA domain-containing protein-like protein [Hapsidospora chrysogenum ATCC 11550]|uniref:UBA domain-containing protein-like protein n=1 Tax=Hapsidospora chrysogenum (strain ATCC 11550 / CBS 779.69 / DSM 880 / IAM 14645 / JCM 23072 / IMI 49137) TaxID=857340 RepID=A0A086TB32_HAPC1|nr:UBA domain-containing protein-like protein [Hapsidospora chrysogenum ATCC 11550]
MDDLSGLDWSSKTNSHPSKPPPMNPPSFSTLQPTPSAFSSGRSTPLQPQVSSGSGSKPAPAKSAQDSFSNLVKFGPSKSNQNQSLAERQAQLEAEKRRKEEEKRKQTEAQFGNGQFWDTLGSRGGATSSPAFHQPAPSNGTKNDDDDLFAAFNKDTEVDNASHFPPPESQRSTPANKTPLDLSDPNSWGATDNPSGGATTFDDDDPFGLNEIKPPSSAPPKQQAADDDDFLGDLAKPVEEIRKQQSATRPQPQPQPGKPIEENDSSSDDDAPPPPQRQAERRRPAENRAQPEDVAFDKAVVKLVDYGFSPEDARRGLSESGAGINVQAAANWLLDDAHRKAKEKSQGRSSSSASREPERRSSRSLAGGEPDITKTAAAVGNSLFKTANSLWKTGQKRMQQAVADLQQDGDPNQPKWMRDAQQGQASGSGKRVESTTDEALMLESGGRPQPSRSRSRQPTEARPASNSRQREPSEPSSSRNSPVPRWQQQSAPPAIFDAKAKLNRLKADDDLSTYSSPNRRRRQAPPAPAKQPEAEPDLLFGTDAPRPSQPLPERPAQRPTPPATKRPTPKPSSPALPRPTRQVPPISPDALQKSTRHRLEGTAHFKRGDYASAHSAYSSSLSAVPPTHPLAILLLTNRALTALKTGEPKQAVDDADRAIRLIGAGNGQGETVAVATENGHDENRDMRDLYGKALSRKAEALEQMEKWSEAGTVWQLCVEGGVGGANAIKGRQRCQDAITPKPKPASAPATKPRPRPSATANLAPQKDSEAVTRLREANQAAAREDDEKFALSESVDARISAWRDGKRDNLRALLGSLDQVLWPDSGWKKVGMHELVMANKVKIAYMKAIAKTHPDKLPQDANTEVRLIAGLVFSTLNESWDKFKAENGL